MTTQFTDDEIETIKSLISDWGSDCPDTDSDKVQELRYKLGLAVRPTAEEIVAREKRYEEIRNSPYGKQMAEIFSANNKFVVQMVEDLMLDNKFIEGMTYGRMLIGPDLKIRLPNDYTKKD